MATRKKNPARRGDWIPQGGKTRGFINAKTGQRISRRQFDKRFGVLQRGGFSSYETKAKTNRKRNATRQALRPARGRCSGKIEFAFKRPTSARGKALAKIQPLIDFSRVRKPAKRFHTKYLIPYNLKSLKWFVDGVRKNKRVWCVGIPNLLMRDSTGRLFYSRVIIHCTMFDELPSVAQLWALIESNIDDNGKVSGLRVVAINVSVTFIDPILHL